MPRMFGTDGVRGLANRDLTAQLALDLGDAAVRVLGDDERSEFEIRRRALVGRDTRVSGDFLAAALSAGMSAGGFDVIDAGIIPTPGVAYLTSVLNVEMGAVISASHNPMPDNGIKFFSAGGTKLPDAVEEEIEAEIAKGYQCVASDALGKAYRLDDACGRYVEFCKSTFPTGLDLKGMKLYLDCAHGAAYHAAPSVFHELGADIVSDGVEPDGFNINRDVGATHTDDLAERTAKAGADLGLAFDGDADRLIMADNQGNVYNGDALLYVMARERIQTMGKSSGVVGTLMTNFALEKRFAELGIPFERAKVGDRYVMEKLLEKGWLYGGESSGHLIALDCQTTGDGIVSALQVLAAVVSSGKDLAQLTADLQLMPQVLINRRIAKGYDWKGNEKFAAAIKACEAELSGSGRVLIRPSGTEPKIKIYYLFHTESGDMAALDALVDSARESMKEITGI